MLTSLGEEEYDGEFVSVPLVACFFVGFSGLGEKGGSSSSCFLLAAFGMLTKGSVSESAWSNSNIA